MAAYVGTNRTFTALDQPITSLTHEVTPNFFDIAGVPAFRGRTFLPDEGLPGKDGVALISYSLWRSAFAGSESVVGSSIELDGRSVQIVGILPSTYRAPYNSITVQPDLFVPASFDDQRMERVRRSMVIVARLRGGVPVEQARAEIAGHYQPDRSRESRRDHAAGRPGQWDSRGPHRRIPPAVLPAPGRCGHYAADRLRQCGEPAVGTLLGARV